MNRPEAEIIASAVSIIRPAWLTSSIVKMLEKHQHRPARQVAIALVAMAYDPEVKTPGLLNTAAGAEYLALSQLGESTYTPPALSESRLCRTHLDREPCKGCAADRKAAPVAPIETDQPKLPGESLVQWARRITETSNEGEQQ